MENAHKDDGPEQVAEQTSNMNMHHETRHVLGFVEKN